MTLLPGTRLSFAVPSVRPALSDQIVSTPTTVSVGSVVEPESVALYGMTLRARLVVLCSLAKNIGTPPLLMMMKPPSDATTLYGVAWFPSSSTMPTSTPDSVALMRADRAAMAPGPSTFLLIFTSRPSAVCSISTLVA